jgi:hypothetical protein
VASKKRFAFGTDSDVDLDEQRRGAEAFIRKALKGYGSPKQIVGSAPSAKTASEFANIFIGDVMGEGAIRDMYPSQVWEPIAERLLVEMYAKMKKPRVRRPATRGIRQSSRTQMR